MKALLARVPLVLLTLAIAFFVTLLTGLLGPLAFAAEERWTGQDKAMHFSISAAVGFAAINQWPNDPLKAFGWALVPGLLKELSDAQKGGTGFSGKDMAANALGAALGVGVGSWLVTRQNGQTVLLYRKEF